MKLFKFLVPVGIAAASLIGGNAAESKNQPPSPPVLEQRTNDSQTVAERTLIMKVSDQGIQSAQHRSHASHVSHRSHSSHRSGF
jgi:hypothetical protein